jgi:hypothetical protein
LQLFSSLLGISGRHNLWSLLQEIPTWLLPKLLKNKNINIK